MQTKLRGSMGLGELKRKATVHLQHMGMPGSSGVHAGEITPGFSCSTLALEKNSSIQVRRYSIRPVVDACVFILWRQARRGRKA